MLLTVFSLIFGTFSLLLASGVVAVLLWAAMQDGKAERLRRVQSETPQPVFVPIPAEYSVTARVSR